MLYILQLIYLKDGEEAVFEAFEAVAIPIIRRYNGKMLLRIRPGDAAYIEHAMERPYEVHLVEFATEEDFVHFQQDEERKQFLHLKEQSIRSALLIKGNRI